MNRCGCVAVVCACIVLTSCASRQTLKVVDGPTASKNHVMFSGGDGDSPETAVRITGAQSQREVFDAEYRVITQKRGKRGKDWKAVGRSSLREGGRVYDIVEIEMLPALSRDYFYFDITGCSWKP